MLHRKLAIVGFKLEVLHIKLDVFHFKLEMDHCKLTKIQFQCVTLHKRCFWKRIKMKAQLPTFAPVGSLFAQSIVAHAMAPTTGCSSAKPLLMEGWPMRLKPSKLARPLRPGAIEHWEGFRTNMLHSAQYQHP